MNASKVCIAGFGQKVSVWLTINRNHLTACSIEEPNRHESIEMDSWFDDHFLLVPVNPKNGPKGTKVCPYLTLMAGKKAVGALRDYSITRLAMALISHYGWQIANGARPLAERGALAKLYAENYAVYVFASRESKLRQAEKLTQVAAG